MQYPISGQEVTNEEKEESKEEETEEQEPVKTEEHKEKVEREPTNRQTFPDVSLNNWAYDEINYLTQREIIFGYENGRFGPNDSITRLQAVSMILREKGMTDFSNVENPGFTDVQPDDDGYENHCKICRARDY